MANFNINEFRRLSGTSTKQLASDFTQKLADEAGARSLSTAELTTELWNELQGTWVGNKGWNIIAVPSPGSTPGDEGDFQLFIAPYLETLTFTNAGAPARNRGGSVDQFIPGLEYQQRITDKDTGELLHIETGMFLNLSEIIDNDNKKQPIPDFNIARSGTIPHGDSIMILGAPPFVEDGAPNIPDISSLPPDLGDNPPLGYTDPYLEPHPGLDVANPNATLRQDLEKQAGEGFEITKTITMVLDSNNNGGISNIPFIVKHANATRMQAVFWLEKVRNKKSGQEFNQLQYTQIIDLEFHRKFMKNQSDPKAKGLITWPHITINTMLEQ